MALEFHDVVVMVKTTRKVHEQARRKGNCCEIDQRGRPEGDVTGPEFFTFERHTRIVIWTKASQRNSAKCTKYYSVLRYCRRQTDVSG